MIIDLLGIYQFIIRVDYLDLVSRSQMCQNHKPQIVLLIKYFFKIHVHNSLNGA